jgi:murein DD-endopeptidase MepM/ murein hydrolase activator NlpD
LITNETMTWMNTLATEKKSIQPASAVSFGAARNGLLQRNCACGQHTMAGVTCESCGKRQAQRSSEHPVPNEIPPMVEEVLGAPGRPLDAASREFFEPRFGHDFSQVRVHTDAKSAESARSLNALAYTVANDIVLGAEQGSPATNAGKRLLAHELTHVVQQGAAGPPRVQREIDATGEVAGIIEHGSVQQAQFKRATAIGRADDPLERQADLVAERVCSTTNQDSYAARNSLQAATQTRKNAQVVQGFSLSATNNGVLQRQPPTAPQPTPTTPQPAPTNPQATPATGKGGFFTFEYEAIRKGSESVCGSGAPLNEVDMPVLVYAPATISSSTVDLFVFFHGWRADLGARTASGEGSKSQGDEKMTDLSHLDEALSGTGRVGIAPQAPKTCKFSTTENKWLFGQFSQWHQAFSKKGFDDLINLVLKNLSATKGLTTPLTAGAMHVAGHSGGGQGIVESTNVKGGARAFADKIQDVTLQDAGYGDTWETMMGWFFQGTPEKTIRVLIAPGDQENTRKVLVKIKSAIADMNKAGTFQITKETIPKPKDQKPLPGGFIIESKWVAKKGATLQGTIIVFFTPKGGHYETSFASMAQAAAAQPTATDDFLGTVQAGGLYRVLPTSGYANKKLPVFEKSDLRKSVKNQSVAVDSKVWVVDVEKVYPFNAKIEDENHKALGWISLIHLGPVAASAQPTPPPPAQPTTSPPPAAPTTPSKVQPKRADPSDSNRGFVTGSGNAVPPTVHDVLRSPGQPLNASTRAFMEPRFGHDFSRVRTHTDANAAESAHEINALAYTVGNNIVFGRGQYAPDALAGSRLLAHELTHVVQQQAASAHSLQAQPDMDQPGNPLEREADLMADAVIGSQRREGPSSATLPYREAIELSDCLRIMGDKAMDYCLEAVPREKSRRICSGSGIRNPLSDMSTFQSPGASGWLGAKFGCHRNSCSRPHRGWDIFAPVGTPVVAAVTGNITRHADPSGLGDFIKLRSLVDPTRAYLYAHLSDREPKGFYCVGNTIGKTGTSGNASSNRPHLHLQLQINGTNVDPGSDFAEPTNVIEETGSSATVIDKTLPEPCAQCAM